MRKPLALLLTSLVGTSGCAFTVHDVKADYSYAVPVASSLAPRSIDVDDFADDRGVANNRMIMNMKNMNGDTTSGGYQAEKPLAEILRDGVVQGLTAANVKVQAEAAELRLKGQLLTFDVTTIMGMWQGTAQGKMTAKFQLTNQRTGNIVWQDTFVGSAEIKGWDAVGVLKATLDDTVTKFISDPYFRQEMAE